VDRGLSVVEGMLSLTDGEVAMDDGDVARLVMRVRRMADLSQRDLAARLGMSPSTVARLETGSGAVSVGLLSRILGLAGLRLVAVASDGQPVTPLARDALRDNGGRRFPAHLDVDLPSEVPKLRQLMPRRDRPPAKGWYRQRPLRDERRQQDGVPPDHPTFADLREAAQRERAHRRRVRALLARAAPPPPECTCEIDCLLSPGCLPGCACQCEPPRPGPHQRE
jgi:HTH-type transcriptional regulator/antitoxin HipB